MDILPFSQKIKAEMEGERFESQVDPQKVLKKALETMSWNGYQDIYAEWIKGMKSALLLWEIYIETDYELGYAHICAI